MSVFDNSLVKAVEEKMKEDLSNHTVSKIVAIRIVAIRNNVSYSYVKELYNSHLEMQAL